MAVVYVVWPTTSCCADWSKRCHVTFITIEWWTCWRPCRPNDIFNLGFIILMPHHLSSAYCLKPASRGIARSKYVGWTDMASAEREPITGVWRRSDPPPVKTRRICINFRSDLLQKWGGHIHPRPPRGDATASIITLFCEAELIHCFRKLWCDSSGR